MAVARLGQPVSDGQPLPPRSDGPERQPYFVVIDDGRADVTNVWTVYPGYRRAGQCQRGDLVRLKGYRWCRYARRITLLSGQRDG
jgi:hypothetical protein